MKGIDGNVANGLGRVVRIERCRNDLTQFEHGSGFADRLVDCDVAGGLHIQATAWVLDVDGDVTFGTDIGQSTHELHIAGHFHGVSRQRHRHKGLRLVVIGLGQWRGIPKIHAATHHHLADGADVDLRTRRTLRRLDRHRQIRPQGVGVKVFQTGDRGLFGRDGLLAHPATTCGGGAVNGDFLILEITVKAVQSFRGFPDLVIGRLPGAALGGHKFVSPLARIPGIGQHRRGVQHFAAAREFFQQLPFAGVREIRQREIQLGGLTHVQVQIAGGHVTHLGLVLGDIHRQIAFLFVLNKQVVIQAQLQGQLRFLERCAIGKSGVREIGGGVGHQAIPIKAKKVKALLLVNLQGGVGLGLTLGPDVVTPLLGLVEQGSACVHDNSIAHIGVGDAADRATAVSRREHALSAQVRDLTVLVGVVFLAQRGAVRDGDGANAVF